MHRIPLSDEKHCNPRSALDEMFKRGTTVSSPSPFFPPYEHSPELKAIEGFVENQPESFKDILRFKQAGNRYTYIGLLITYPPRKKESPYSNEKIIGLFYEDKSPEMELRGGKKVRFKQDFVLYDGKVFKFLIGEQWFKKFPNLERYRQHTMTEKEFNDKVTNGQHYRSVYGSGKLDHHYYEKDDLPLQIRNQLT